MGGSFCGNVAAFSSYYVIPIDCLLSKACSDLSESRLKYCIKWILLRMVVKKECAIWSTAEHCPFNWKLEENNTISQLKTPTAVINC